MPPCAERHYRGANLDAGMTLWYINFHLIE